jgi:hypothetical protein
MLVQNDFLELALARPGSEIHKNRIRRLIGSRIADPAKGKHHKHHIAPASWHPEHAKNKKNLVRLTHREHFVIHKMLHRAFPEDVSMSRAFHLMSTFGVGSCKGTRRFASSKQYSESRKWVSAEMSANNPMKRVEVKAKKSAWEKANYDNKPDDAGNNYKKNNPMRDPEKIKKMVETRRKNGSYTRKTSTRDVTNSGKPTNVIRRFTYNNPMRDPVFAGKLIERMKNNNPMRDPEVARKSGTASARTRSSYEYWFKNTLIPKFIGDIECLKRDIINGRTLKYIMETHDLKRDFAVSCIKRIKENENATSRATS